MRDERQAEDHNALFLQELTQSHCCLRRNVGDFTLSDSDGLANRGFALRALMFCFLLSVPAAHAVTPTQLLVGQRTPYAELDRLPATPLTIPGGEIAVAFAAGSPGPDRGRILDWVKSSARAVAAYYERFPASTTRLLIVPRPGRGVSGGRTWAHRGAAIRIRIGELTTERDLQNDWVLVHEMTHLAFPSLPEQHNWLEEGLATYVEPIARAQVGLLSAEKVWAALVQGLPKGLPSSGDRGLDHTPTWGRTYWGGALYCLLADLEIRRRTENRRGLQHALRAILAAGNMETASELAPLLEIGDRAVGVPVLTELYERMKDEPAPVDLSAIWRRLGVQPDGRTVRFIDDAPEAAIRSAITAPSTG
jgi:hypothetical protein